MIKELKEQLAHFICNRRFMIAVFLFAVAGYGYLLTHGTCGVDDISIELYFDKGLGVAIGRWPFYLINKIIPIAEYTPFWGDFITLLIMIFAGIMWCALIRTIIKNDIPMICYMVFMAFFLNYSLVTEVYIYYLQNGLGFVFLFVAIAIWGTYYLYQNKVGIKSNLTIRIMIGICMTLSISFYESAACIYVSGILLLLCVDALKSKKECVFGQKKAIQVLFFVIRYILYAMLVRRVIRAVLMRVYGIAPYYFYRSAFNLEWIYEGGINGFIQRMQEILVQILLDYFLIGVAYLPILLFGISTVAFVVLLIYKSRQKKCLLLVLYGAMFYLSLFALCFIEGHAVTYRACQSFTIFVAITFMGLMYLVLKWNGIRRYAGIVAIVLVIGLSTLDMNYRFWLDYMKTEYEMTVVHDIADELLSGKYDVENKSVVIVGDFELPDEILKHYSIEEGEFGWSLINWAIQLSDSNSKKEQYIYVQCADSIIDWAVQAFSVGYGYNYAMRQVFDYCGYDINWADAQECEEVFKLYYPRDEVLFDIDQTLQYYTEMYGENEGFPNEGYIEETDKYVVIKL